MLPNQNSFVAIDSSGQIRVSAQSVAEAKIAIKERVEMYIVKNS
jgi:hypothetical protein